jgi:hypothetical protein
MPGLPRPRRRVGAAEYQRGEYVMPRRFSREWDRLERISEGVVSLAGCGGGGAELDLWGECGVMSDCHWAPRFTGPLFSESSQAGNGIFIYFGGPEGMNALGSKEARKRVTFFELKFQWIFVEISPDQFFTKNDGRFFPRCKQNLL